jgi:GDPmannose 4,6-dehydratase
MEALWMLANQDQVDECVIGTGVGHSVQEWLSRCFRIAGLNWEDHVCDLPGFKSPYAALVSSPQTIRSLGWIPKIEMDELAQMLMVEAANENP